MKADIHPKLHPVVFIDSSNGAEFCTFSTLTSEKTKKIEGVEYFVISVDISSASHPFYTGEKMLVDTAGRVDKFKQRMAAAEKLKEGHQNAQVKKLKEKKESLEEKVTRKAKLNTLAKAEEKEKKAPAKKVVAPKAEEKVEKKAPVKEEKKKEVKKVVKGK